MNAIIKVLSEFSLSTDAISNVLQQLELLAELNKEIKNLLEDTSKWDGDTHNKTAQIHGMLCEYEKTLYPLYGELRTALSDLTTLTDDFCFDSFLVNSIRSW